ncbi:MAG: hypothetical protein U0Y10_22010 [Spirosomataceae bacterium]
MKQKRFWLRIGLIVLAVPIAYLWWFPQVWRCQTIGWRGYVEIQPNIWIPQEMHFNSNAARRHSMDSAFFQRVAEARGRVRRLWGSRVGDCPIIFAGHGYSPFGNFALEGDAVGAHIRSPFGSWIVLHEWNADVLAHEMMHEELYRRLGWWVSSQQIPAWFDEGLALMVDYRFSTPHVSWRYQVFQKQWLTYTQNGKTAPRLEGLSSSRNFFAGNYYQQLKAYLTAGKAVAWWLQKGAKQSLLALVKRLEAGEAFESAFRNSGKQP